MKDSFCYLASNAIRYEYDKISPCCWIKQKCDTTAPQEEIDNYLKWVRSINDWVPECVHCKSYEDKGMSSGRQQFNKIFNDLQINDSIEPGDVVCLEMQIDGDCNAACLMCSDINSTTWKKYNASNAKEIKIKITENVRSTTQRRKKVVYENIDFSKIKLVTFLGGEPFKNNFYIEFLSKLAENNNNLNDVSLNFVTNGSFCPPKEIFDLWKKFHQVRINFSIDGIGEHFQYLRWPLVWDQVVDNLHYFDQHRSNNVTMLTSYTLTPLNIFYHDRYLNWAKKYKFSQRFFTRPDAATGVMNLSSIPLAYKKILHEKYSSDDRLTKLLTNFDITNHIKFIKYLKYHDQKRKLNWREIFPEVSKYFFEIKQIDK